jgi:hypothetical protein
MSNAAVVDAASKPGNTNPTGPARLTLPPASVATNSRSVNSGDLDSLIAPLGITERDITAQELSKIRDLLKANPSLEPVIRDLVGLVEGGKVERLPAVYLLKKLVSDLPSSSVLGQISPGQFNESIGLIRDMGSDVASRAIMYGGHAALLGVTSGAIPVSALTPPPRPTATLVSNSSSQADSPRPPLSLMNGDLSPDERLIYDYMADQHGKNDWRGAPGQCSTYVFHGALKPAGVPLFDPKNLAHDWGNTMPLSKIWDLIEDGTIKSGDAIAISKNGDLRDMTAHDIYTQLPHYMMLVKGPQGWVVYDNADSCGKDGIPLEKAIEVYNSETQPRPYLNLHYHTGGILAGLLRAKQRS